jgi:hypothetical protein
MMTSFIFLPFIVSAVAGVGFPPVMVKQPVESEILFKVSLNVNRSKSFEILCEADGEPKPK